MKSPAHCASIPAHQPFVNTLAAWILQHQGADAASLSKMLVLLPNRRACRALREAFLEAAQGRPLLLPRIQPLGDIDEDSVILHHDSALSIPAPIAPLRRDLLLTRLVMHFIGTLEPSLQSALDLARQLARLIDEVVREGLDFKALASLAPEELSEHWQKVLQFLTIITQHWPGVLKNEEALDPAAHRNLLLKATGDYWTQSSPDYPIIAAGSTGSIPAVARLLSVIARLPQGKVVLPALDTEMPDAEWELLTETHPQFGLKQLLKTMGIARENVRSLTDDALTADQQARQKCLHAVYLPPFLTAGWSQAKLPLEEGLRGMRLLVADTLLDEARMIAIAFRQVLEQPGRRAALVTPDRQLARMVAAQMQRFGVEIDDSAGRSLRDTPSANFMRLVAHVAASQAAPVPLLSLLRHPLAGVGMATAECRRLSRLLELHALRGIRPAPGLESLIEETQAPELNTFLQALRESMSPLTHGFEKKTMPVRTLLMAHMQCAEQLAATGDEAGAARLWAGEAGNALASFLAELLPHAEVLPDISPMDYPGLFDALLAQPVYRPKFGLHPRLHILSPMEARLQQFDLVILGGLNEGMWPSSPEADPWMSRPMRDSFGLPAPEMLIGRSAHDFAMLCAAPDVLLTRARKAEGAPTVPSRWLVRLETLVKGLDTQAFARLSDDGWYREALSRLDAPEDITPLLRPQPVPPLEARPRQLRVTAIDTWLRDPYTIYARHILKLRALNPLDEDPDAADFGNLVHDALDAFVTKWPVQLPLQALAELLACGRASFARMAHRPAVDCLWWPRFEAMAAWFIAQEQERRRHILHVLSELEGQWTLAVDGQAFTLTTRIDRLEEHANGITLVDYKTGSLPTKADIEHGLANQLPLEALIVKYGLLTPSSFNKRGDISLEYWKLAAMPDKCEIKPIGSDPEEIRARLESLVRLYNDPAKSYAAPSFVPGRAYGDYTHLTRREEWETV